MALEFDLYVNPRGEKELTTIEFMPIARRGELDDEGYRLLAHELADTKRNELRHLGIRAVVDVVRLDCMTPEEIAQQVKQAEAVEAAGGTLPTTQDIIAQHMPGGLAT